MPTGQISHSAYDRLVITVPYLKIPVRHCPRVLYLEATDGRSSFKRTDDVRQTIRRTISMISTHEENLRRLPDNKRTDAHGHFVTPR